MKYFPKLLLPSSQYFYMDISVISVTFCNSEPVTPCQKAEWRKTRNIFQRPVVVNWSLFETQNVCNLHCGWDYKGKLVHRSVPGDWAWVFARPIISRPTAAENIHYWPALYHINQTPAWKLKLEYLTNLWPLAPDIHSFWISFNSYCKNPVWPSRQCF